MKLNELNNVLNVTANMGMSHDELSAPTPRNAVDYDGFDDPQDGGDEGKKKSKPNVAQLLIELAEENAELWHTPEGIAWATIKVDGHLENRRIDSKSSSFRCWLMGLFYEQNGAVANDKAIRSVLEILQHKARKGPTHKTYLRWARVGDRIYCDLGSDRWDAVEIDSAGWRIVSNPPVKFRRTARTAPMPQPIAGNMDDLRPLLHTTDENWLAIKAVILDAAKAEGPFYVLCVTGEQGSAKSTACRIIRRVIDPMHTGELSSFPKDESDFGVMAQHEYILAFDNVSFLKSEMSDVLCRASTGGGIKTRQLFSDDDLVVLPICSPMVLNGIPDFATANDLLSRSLIVNQPSIPDHQRKDEKTLRAEFDRVWPGVFGGILDHISRGLLDVNRTIIPNLPRMADSAKWITACLQNDSFIQLATANEEEAISAGLENSPLAQTIKHVLGRHAGSWTGTASELVQEAKKAANEHGSSGRLPEGPRAWAASLRREAPALRKGWNMKVIFRRHEKCRHIELGYEA